MTGGNSLLQRKFVENIRQQIKQWGVLPQNLRYHQLRILLPLSTSAKTYTFKLGDKDATPGVSPVGIESRLKTSSVFFGNLFALGIFKVPVVSSVQNLGNGKFVTYPDKNMFTVTGEAVALETVYNGFLTLKTDQDIRLDRLPTHVFRQVPRTQDDTITHPSFGDYLTDFSSSFLFFGDRTNSAVLEMEAVAAVTGIAGGTNGDSEVNVNYLDFRVGGFEVVNGADNKRILDWYKAQRGE